MADWSIQIRGNGPANTAVGYPFDVNRMFDVLVDDLKKTGHELSVASLVVDGVSQEAKPLV